MYDPLKGHSTRDRLHATNRVVEKSLEHIRPLHVAFMEYENAVYSEEILAAIEELRIDCKEEHS